MIIKIVIKSAISLVFFISASMKLRDLHSVVLEINNILRLNKSKYSFLLIITYLLIILEFSIAVLYTITNTKMVEYVVLVLMIFFSFYIIIKRTFNNQYTCSCFGNISILNKYPLQRNIILISLILINIFNNNSLEIIPAVYILSINSGITVFLIYYDYYLNNIV